MPWRRMFLRESPSPNENETQVALVYCRQQNTKTSACLRCIFRSSLFSCTVRRMFPARTRKRWRSGILCSYSQRSCFCCEPPLKRTSWGSRRSCVAMDDYNAVEHFMFALTVDNKWIKMDRVGATLCDFFAHIVAASYASPDLYNYTPDGYKFLDCEFPHPNVESRSRARIAQDVAIALESSLKNQIFGFIVLCI